MICPRCKESNLVDIRVMDDVEIIEISLTSRGIEPTYAVKKSHRTLWCNGCNVRLGRAPNTPFA